MPCDSSHMEAHGDEVQSSIVRELLREIDGQPFDHKKRAEYYGNLKTFDEDTARLCQWCRENPLKVKQKSLELQIWWRDHQDIDRRRS